MGQKKRGDREMFKVRRKVTYSFEGTVFEFLMSVDDSITQSGLLWGPTHSDGIDFTRAEAEHWLNEAERRNFNNNVLCHEIVEG